jgi:hypothetical protein
MVRFAFIAIQPADACDILNSWANSPHPLTLLCAKTCRSKTLDALVKQCPNVERIDLPIEANDLSGWAKYLIEAKQSYHFLAIHIPWSQLLFNYLSTYLKYKSFSFPVLISPEQLNQPLPGTFSWIARQYGTCIDLTNLIKSSRKLCTDQPQQTIDLTDILQAKCIVGIGRGVSTKAQYTVLETFALRHGAAIGGSVYAMDKGWITQKQLIGQSGQSITAALYIAFGLSGSIHHRAGIPRSTRIIAINQDKQAPIMQYAHAIWLTNLNMAINQMAKYLSLNQHKESIL